ncbi:hypothetical protein JYK00_04620 [Thermosipho ferrireducens]|uniref:Uncharacterized protein n=1 Tax=Thermosipho ferrireducens TaxID=2571116 RepID=A0ABX7SA52_9BACT|nr:hypothetical protein [Thermosipho ferrireducens]QTA38795.1 hypothetical protein JYK00_04620 [Thermosipho ferrireducens]
MSFLKDEFELYKQFNLEKVEENYKFKEIKSNTLKIGDIFVIYTTHFPIYGIVAEKIGEMYECIYLTPELFLASPLAKRIELDHLVSIVAITHIRFYVFKDFAEKHCEVIKNEKEKLKDIIENSTKLNNEFYTGYRKKFFEIEVKKLSKLFEIFFERMEKIIIQEETKNNIVILSVSEELKSGLNKERLVAATEGIRGYNFLAIFEGEVLKIYPEDEFVGKQGKIVFKDEVLYEGKLPKTIIVENIADLDNETIRKNLKIIREG